MKESVGGQRNLVVEDAGTSPARQAQGEIKANVLDKQEQLCKLSRALAVLASASVRTGK